MDIRKTEYVIFDVETTGLSPLRGDRMVEIGAIRVKDMKIVDRFESLINPQRNLSEEAQRVNKITEAMVEDAPIADEILPQMIDFIGGACVVGHNVKFDLDFLCYELSLLGRKLQDTTPALDTLKMSRGLMPHLRTHRLSFLAEVLGVQIGATHRALADVELTLGVMVHLFDIAHECQIGDLRELLRRYAVQKPSFKIKQLAQDVLF